MVFNVPPRCPSDFSDRTSGVRLKNIKAGVSELADETDSKSVIRKGVWVRVPPPAPKQYNPNQLFLIGDGFGLFVYFDRYENTYFPNGVIKRSTSKPRGKRKPKKQS